VTVFFGAAGAFESFLETLQYTQKKQISTISQSRTVGLCKSKNQHSERYAGPLTADLRTKLHTKEENSDSFMDIFPWMEIQ
jgi:hypothetical protein